MRAKYVFLALFVVSFLLSAAHPAHAARKKTKTRTKQSVSAVNSYKEPKFPSCPHPGGTQVAGYGEGWHWIVGESVLRWGSDFVFAQGDGNYVQCYCAKALTEGESTFISGGIQTNWLRVATIDVGLKDWLLTQGWILVPNGADFGLSPEAYLAKNLNYSCDNSCVTNVTQKNTTVVDVVINEKAETGKNTASSNTDGDVEIKTGDAFNFVSVETVGGSNSVQ